MSLRGAEPADVYVTWQVADAPLPLKVQGDDVNVEAVLVELNVTVPVGGVGVPGEVSVTVAVHVVALPTMIDTGEQLTPVEVARFVTVKVDSPVLVPWVVSPL
jgi:hypothetical protein